MVDLSGHRLAEMDASSENEFFGRTLNDSCVRTPINKECDLGLRPPRDRRRVSQRACRFLTLTSLVLGGLIYQNSGELLLKGRERSGCLANVSTTSKSPRYYPVDVSPEVAAILPSFDWSTVSTPTLLYMFCIS